MLENSVLLSAYLRGDEIMEKIINFAVVAHVDAGKSTLVDALLKQNGVFRENEQVVDCVVET